MIGYRAGMKPLMDDRQRINGGYILLAREIADSFLMEKPPLYLKLWVWMLMRARYRDGKHLKRGQLLTAINEMRDATAYRIGYRNNRPTRDQIRNAYEAFTKASMITTAKTTRGMIITICNYEFYQNPKNYETHNEAPPEDTTKTQQGPHYSKRKIIKDKKVNSGEDPPPKPSWRTDFQIYLTECRESYQELLDDPDWIEIQKRNNPGVHIHRTMEKAATTYWSTEAGWEKKKSKKHKSIDWNRTWQNAINQPFNRVYQDAVDKEFSYSEPKEFDIANQFQDR